MNEKISHILEIFSLQGMYLIICTQHELFQIISKYKMYKGGLGYS